MRSIVSLLLSISLLVGFPAAAASKEWSPQPWLDDLSQTQQAFATKYANIDWLEKDRDVSLPALFARASARLRLARSDEEARGIFDGLIDSIGDGHVSIAWGQAAVTKRDQPAAVAVPYDACDALGFDQKRSATGIVASLPNYRAVGASTPFPAGLIRVGTRRVGAIRISGFEPQGFPTICRAAFQALHRSAKMPCNDLCQDNILTWAYTNLTFALEEQVRVLKNSGAEVLLVDLSSNGGGTEWAEAAARILSLKTLTSGQRGFVRGPHWSAQWKALSTRLRAEAASASPRDRERLLQWAAQSERAHADAEVPCSKANGCSIVARAGYATGLVGTAHAGEFGGKSWADLIFSLAQFPYHDSVWSGPLLVLVDDQTWSAAEEFAAILQDNTAATIIGTRTGGAGCGHTNGGTPTTLNNSGATLELPDCVRFRADGSNEVAGIIPDVLTGMKASDGQAIRARLIALHLPQAIALAAKGKMP